MNIPLKIGELESAINRFKRARPFDDYVLPIELRLMAALYGKMIYLQLSVYDLDRENHPTQVVVQYWKDESKDAMENTAKRSLS